MNTDGERAWSYTDLKTTDSNNVPAGYMGAQARLYDSNANLKKSSSMVYNSEADYLLSVVTVYYVTGGTFYGKGKVELYNGNGYDPYDTYQSPSQNNTASSIPSQLDNIPAYRVNDRGQIYGSALLASTTGYEPDLISAVGIDGTIGYVYSTDLVGEVPNTPEEAVELMSHREENREILLYESDGETVIGTFLIETVLRDIIPEE